MMDDVQDVKFTDLVGETLASNEPARELWQLVAQEFDRIGPESASELLNAQQQQLEEQVQRLINEFNRG